MHEDQPSLAEFAGDNDDEIQRTLGMRVVLSATLATGIGPNAVHAADLAEPLAREIVRQDATSAYGYGGFNPILDPRCRIIPQPEAKLYGDTARFRLTAVCESRGLYADSVLFP